MSRATMRLRPGRRFTSGVGPYEHLRPVDYAGSPLLLPQATAWGPGMWFDATDGQIKGTSVDSTEPTWGATVAFADAGTPALNASGLQTLLDSTVASLTQNVKITVPNTSQFGGRILLPKNATAFKIGIIPADVSMLPTQSPGTSRGTYANRVDWAIRTSLPEFYPTGTNEPSFWTDSGSGSASRGYFLRGLHLTERGQAAEAQTAMIAIIPRNDTGHESDYQVSGNYAESIIISQCVFDGGANSIVRRGVALNGRGVAVVDCVGKGIGKTAGDTQFVAVNYGQGPYKCHNTWSSVTGATEGYMSGGEALPDAAVVDLNPCDQEITGNYFSRPNVGEYGYISGANGSKNFYEHKLGKRVVSDGNIGGYNDGGGQQYGVLIRLTDQFGNSPFADTSDVVCTNWKIIGGPGGYQVAQKLFTGPANTNKMRRIWLANCIGANFTETTACKALAMPGQNVEDVVVRWCTLLSGGPLNGTASTVVFDQYTLVHTNPDFQIRSNFNVQNVSAFNYTNDGITKTMAATQAWDTGTTKTVTADKWMIARLDVTVGGVNEVTYAAGAGYDSEYLALAALPSAPNVTDSLLGYITFQAGASLWTAGTDALFGGTGGVPAVYTRYWSFVKQTKTDVRFNITASPDDTGEFNDAYALTNADGGGGGTPGFDNTTVGSTYQDNIVPGTHGSYARQIRPANRAAIKFVDLAGGDFHLQSDSPAKGLGPQGQDYGVQFSVFDAVIARVLP
jgi:hypothetical protein